MLNRLLGKTSHKSKRQQTPSAESSRRLIGHDFVLRPDRRDLSRLPPGTSTSPRSLYIAGPPPEDWISYRPAPQIPDNRPVPGMEDEQPEPAYSRPASDFVESSGDTVTIDRKTYQKLKNNAAVGQRLRGILEAAASQQLSMTDDDGNDDITAQGIVAGMLVPPSYPTPEPYHAVIMSRREATVWRSLQRLPGLFGTRDWLRPMRQALSTLLQATRHLELRFGVADVCGGLRQQQALERLAVEAQYPDVCPRDNDDGSDADSDADEQPDRLSAAWNAEQLAGLSQQAAGLGQRLLAVEQRAAAGTAPFCRRVMALPRLDQEEPLQVSLRHIAAGVSIYDLARRALPTVGRRFPADPAREIWLNCDRGVQRWLGPEPPQPPSPSAPPQPGTLLAHWIQTTAASPAFAAEIQQLADDAVFSAANAQRHSSCPCAGCQQAGAAGTISYERPRLVDIKRQPRVTQRPQTTKPPTKPSTTQKPPTTTKPLQQPAPSRQSGSSISPRLQTSSPPASPQSTVSSVTAWLLGAPAPTRPPGRSTASRATPSSAWLKSHTGSAAARSDLLPQRAARTAAASPPQTSPTRPSPPSRPRAPRSHPRRASPQTAQPVSPLSSPSSTPPQPVSPLSTSQSSRSRTSSRGNHARRQHQPMWR